MKKILAFFLLLAFAFSANAQLLWKISGNGLAQPSYIMGTHHLAPLHIKDSIAGMLKAMDETQQVYGELKMTDVQSPAVMQLMQKMIMIESDTTLQSLLTPQEYELANKYSKENLKMDLAMVPKIKPAFLINNMTVILYMKKVQNYNPQEQLDSYFQIQAAQQGKAVAGLETPEFQFDLLYNKTSLKRQAQQLMCLFNNIDTAIRQLKDLTVAYMHQDLEAMMKISDERFNNNCDPLPQEIEILIYNRNKSWASMLPSIMKDKPTFVAVGALHLPGEKGLLNLLKKQGYTVEPVK